MKEKNSIVRRIILPLMVAGAVIPIMTTTAGRSEWPANGKIGPFDVHHAEFDSIKTDLHDYIWPTDASTRITSSFAEYRSTHFHGGIDISTNGQQGYSVFAVRDGYVYRVHLTPNGYGKMLFIRHRDGYYSTYAHLSGFNEVISRAVRAEQERTGRYAVDLLFDSIQIPVRRGEIVAFTGDTGFGPPHLHFELRDENLNPVNPLLCANYDVDDGIPPTIRRLLIAPLDVTSSVENNDSPRIITRFAGKRGHYTIREPVRVHGRIGIGVEALDRSEGSASKAGIHSMELYLDDSLVYRMTLDRVPAEETKQILLHYDFPMILDGRGKFQKLYVETGNVLPFYGRFGEGSGVITTEDISEGEHAYRILVKDIRGNTTELTGMLLANHAPSIGIRNLDAREIVIRGTNLRDIERYYIFGKKNYASAWSQHTLTKGRYDVEDSLVHLPVEMKNYDIVKVIAETRWGSRSAPQFYYNRKPVGPAHKVFIDHDIYESVVRLTVTTAGIFTEPPVVRVREGDSEQVIPMEAVNESKYIGVYTPTDNLTGVREALVSADVNGRPVTATESMNFITVSAHRAGKIPADNGGLTLSFDSGAVYKTMHIQVSTESSRGSTVFTLEPQDELLNKGIHVTLPVPDGERYARPGLYYRGNGGWVFQTSIPDSGNGTFSTLLDRTLGEVAVLDDEVPPSIGRLRTSMRGGRLAFTCSYGDNLSGVDTDELNVTIDDHRIIPEVDGEHHRLTYKATEQLPRGRHMLTLRVKDRAGNAAEFTRAFNAR